MKYRSKKRVTVVGTFAVPLAMMTIVVPTAYADPIAVAIDPDVQSGTFDGWGTSLAWSANYTGDWVNREELLDLLFDQNPAANSLGLNLARYNIGGGDNPANAGQLRAGGDVPGWKRSADAPYDWTADPRQRWWLKAARQKVGSSFQADVIAYSAPWWMTKSQRSNGIGDGREDNLLPGYEGRFAAYLADVTQHIAQEDGITFRVLSPLNEPSTPYWTATARQEGMHVSPGVAQMRILDATYDALRARNLKTRLSAVDETGIDLSISDFEALGKAGFNLSRIDQLNTHTYSGGDRAKLLNIAKGSAGVRLTMSEMTYGGGTYDPQGMGASLEMAQGITKDMKELQPSEWVFWQALESQAEVRAGNGNWGVVTHGDSESQSYSITRAFHGLRQYTNFIRPGSTFVWNSDARTLTSLDRTGGKLTIVSYNDTAAPIQLKYDLSGFSSVSSSATAYRTTSTENRAAVANVATAGKSLVAALPAKSVTTLVLNVRDTTPARIVNGNFERDGSAVRSPAGWLSWGGDSYGTHLDGVYLQDNSTLVPNSRFEAVHYRGVPYHIYTWQQPKVANGTYTLRATARTSGGTETARMLARSGGREWSVPIPASTQYAPFQIPGIVVRDGIIEVGFETKAPGGKWVTFDNVELVS